MSVQESLNKINKDIDILLKEKELYNNKVELIKDELVKIILSKNLLKGTKWILDIHGVLRLDSYTKEDEETYILNQCSKIIKRILDIKPLNNLIINLDNDTSLSICKDFIPELIFNSDMLAEIVNKFGLIVDADFLSEEIRMVKNDIESYQEELESLIALQEKLQ